MCVPRTRQWWFIVCLNQRNNTDSSNIIKTMCHRKLQIERDLPFGRKKSARVKPILTAGLVRWGTISAFKMSLGSWEQPHCQQKHSPSSCPLFMNNGFSDPPYILHRCQSISLRSNWATEMLSHSLHGAAFRNSSKTLQDSCVFSSLLLLLGQTLWRMSCLSATRGNIAAKHYNTAPCHSLFHSLIKGIGCVCMCANVHENMSQALFYNNEGQQCCLCKSKAPMTCQQPTCAVCLLQRDQTDRHMLFLCPLLSLR